MAVALAVVSGVLWITCLIWWIFVGIPRRRRARKMEMEALYERARRSSAKLAAYTEEEYGPLGMTADEILSHENGEKQDLVLGALCYRIAEKQARRGPGSLTETERRLCAVDSLNGEVNNGGFDQYFFNSPGNNAETALAGLREMGAPGAAAILERAMAVFPGGRPPADRFERQEALERIDRRAQPVWEQCDSDFYDLRDEDVCELCLAYARRKRAEILLP